MNTCRCLRISILVALAVMVGLTASVRAEGDLTDPYEIIKRHIEAIGGLEALKAESTSYVETDIAVAGLSGTVKAWRKAPIYSREDVDLKILKQSSGDNGQFLWSVDANGQLQINKDEDALKRRELSKHLAEFEYLDPNSDIFDLSFVGLDTAGGSTCYVVKTKNSINSDTTLTFIGTTDFMEHKEVLFMPDAESHTLYSDYREVGGILRPFKQEINSLPIQQKVSLQITTYESNVEIDPSIFEPPGERKKDFRFVEGDRIEDVPFEYIYGHIFVKVIVNCRERLWVLDSGAGMSIIDSAFAGELGLEVEGDLKGRGIGSEVKISFAKVPHMSIRGIEFDEQTVGVMDLASIIHRAGMEASGILGYDFISRFVVKVDYAARTLSFYDPNTFEYEGNGQVIEAPLKGSIMTVPVTVDEKYTGRWQIDLGAGSSSFHYPFASEHGLLDRPGVETIAYGAGGELHSRMVQFESMQLAGFKVASPRIDMPTEDPVGGFGNEETDGNLGNDILRRFTIYMDYNQQKIVLEKGADFDREFPTEKTGLQIMIDDQDRYEVVCVSKGTPGAKAGFKKGDIVQAVNGIDVRHLTGLSALKEIRSVEAGTRLKFTIVRDGEERELEVKLADLL